MSEIMERNKIIKYRQYRKFEVDNIKRIICNFKILIGISRNFSKWNIEGHVGRQKLEEFVCTRRWINK